MATTWQGTLTSWLPAPFDALITDDLQYRFKSSDKGYAYTVKLSDQRSMSAPVQAIVGGRRHGLGFLVPIQEIDGLPLARRTLVQARYAWSPERQKLLLAPGCPSGKPQSVEAALGVALSPTFESRCLKCHGQPKADTGPRGGVRCESCHGPGSEHLVVLGRGDGSKGIVNPKHATRRAYEFAPDAMSG